MTRKNNGGNKEPKPQKSKSGAETRKRPAAKKNATIVVVPTLPGIKLASANFMSGGPPPMPAEADAKFGFADFLNQVSDAMISAQQKMDLQSEAYIGGSSSPRPLPTMFRIPKLSANMKFAISSDDTKKVSLLFYSTSATASQMQQQEITFDLVAAPPPPETMPALPRAAYVPLMPRIELVFNQSERKQMLVTLLANNNTLTALGIAPAPAPNPDDYNRLVLWRFVVPSGADNAPTLVLAALGSITGNPPGNSARMCFCVFAPGDASILSVTPLPLTAADPTTPLCARFLDAAGSRQDKLLKPAS